MKVIPLGNTRYPSRLRDDLDPPACLYVEGDLGLLDKKPTVGIIGARRCSGYGRDIAVEWGRALSEDGVHVVSGLALGIDGAAHEGALLGGTAPIAVVGTGLDVVYPPANARLWRQVGEQGVIVSESPPGSEAEPWRFPRRNRIIAALSDVLVVIESTVKSGTHHTVMAATERNVPIMAVPGPIRSPQSEGTNQLLAEYAEIRPACDVQDVIVALSLESRPGGSAFDCDSGENPTHDEDAELLQVVDWVATPTELVLARSRLTIEALLPMLCRLEISGRVRRTALGWERT